MRLAVLSLALLTSAAAAEPVDCDAIEKATSPVELTYHDGSEAAVREAETGR